MQKGFKMFKKVCRFLGVGSAAIVSSSAFAEIPADVTAAISGSLSDGQVVGWAVVGVLAGIFVFKIVKRMM